MSAPSSPPASGQPSEQTQNIATAIAAVSEHATVLIREEVELAKAELTLKATKLARGAFVGVVAGVFILMALVFLLDGFAWLLYYVIPGGDFTYFWGFFAMAAILLALGALAGLLAAKVVKKGSPPVPTMAIEEARRIRDTVSTGTQTPPLAPNMAPAPSAPSTAPAPSAPGMAPAPSAPSAPGGSGGSGGASG